MMVDFPLPEAPVTETNSPVLISRLIPLKIFQMKKVPANFRIKRRKKFFKMKVLFQLKKLKK